MSTETQDHGGHALAKTGTLFLSLGSAHAKKALVEESQDRGVTVTDLVRSFIAEDTGFLWSPERGFTRYKGTSGDMQLRIGVEWKERLIAMRDKTGVSIVAWIKDKIGYKPEEDE